MINPTEEARRIDEAAAKFPERFGLRAFPDKVFSISKSASYVLDDGSDVMLYTYVLTAAGEWSSFAKGTVTELTREIVPVNPHAKIASTR